MKMKRNEKMQSNSKVSNKQQNNITNRESNKISNSNNSKITNKKSCNNNVTNSNKKSVGFVSDSSSFELDEDSDHSFQLRDCK